MSDSKSNGGLGISGVLTIVFIVLKLVGVIDWSWLWVLSPLWINVGIVIILAIIIVIINNKSKNKRKKSDKLEW